ncbi:hypothetical protein [Thermoanaerobacter kivui]|uniref:hypothetical protein n=1 Tax=Thermoanaerobacter kivui TaxID=2325 RepID=UPI0011DCB1FA|nr:hypothetical protein [Thermoanaerobacter kivui]
MGYYNSSTPFISIFSTFVFLRLNLKTEAGFINNIGVSVAQNERLAEVINRMDDEADYNVVKKEVFVT